MGGSCPEGQHRDALVGECRNCHKVCLQPHVIPRCASYCASARCNALHGHYYDQLVKKCIKCADICGQHPAHCSQYCQTSPARVTTKMLLGDVSSPVLNFRGPAALEDSALLLYSLLTVCLVLLFSSLSLALVVFLRGGKAKASNPGTAERANPKQKSVVQLGQEFGFPSSQQGTRSKDFLTTSSCPTNRDPSDDSSPTETCVCVHCFPDQKAVGQGNDTPLRPPFLFYPHAVLQRAQIQKGGPLWSEESLHSSGLKAQEEAAVR